jgi:hypothetical protein
MSEVSLVRGRLARRVVALLLAVPFLVPVPPVSAAQEPEAAAAAAAPKGTIRIPIDLIPDAPGPLPVLTLRNQKPPVKLVQDLLRGSSSPDVQLLPLSQAPYLPKGREQALTRILGAFTKDHLVAYVDPRTGDAEMFPALGELKGTPNGPDPARAVAITEELFGRADVIGADDTKFAVGEPQDLFGAQGVLNGSTGERGAPLLLYVPIRRFVAGYPVYGAGSRGLAVVASDHSVQGFLRRWKTGKTIGTVKDRRTPQQIAFAIRAQLVSLARRSDIEVDSVEVAYYDGNARFLQPVYRFTAVEHVLPSSPGNERTEDNFLVGFVPIGAAREPIPSLATPPGPLPVLPRKRPAPTTTAAIPPGDPLVGRYVVRQDDPNWVASANSFWNNLTSFWGTFFFTNAQYYWAYPFEFTTSAYYYVNNVHVALTEVHGDWWLYSTLKNCCDLVDVDTDINFPGFGAAAGGLLAYWIIHSCEVVPSPDDTANWPDPWWDVFGGLHSVLGYRTIMYIADGTTGPFGLNLRFGAPVVSAWLNAVSSSSAYSGHPTMVMHGQVKPLGRASTISMCGQENDSVYDVSAQGRANCLRIFWFGN